MVGGEGSTLLPHDPQLRVLPTQEGRGQVLFLLNPREGRVGTTAESFKKGNEHVLQETPFPFPPKNSNY